MLIFSRSRKVINVVWAAAFGLRGGMRSRPAIYMDAGSRGGLSRQWHYLWRAGLIAPVFVETDPNAAAEIRARYPLSVVVETGIWSTEGDKTQYLTSQPGASSMFLPSPDPRLPDSIKTMLTIQKELNVPVVTAEAALSRLGIVPEIVKIDIQGAEIEALKGFGPLLYSVPCVELEVTFMRCYQNQPLFGEVYDYMADAGFGLFDLKVFGVHGTRNAVQANAFFCRKDIVSPRQRAVETLFLLANGFSYWP
jgi:FkbM family methyltransferase